MLLWKQQSKLSRSCSWFGQFVKKDTRKKNQNEGESGGGGGGGETFTITSNCYVSLLIPFGQMETIVLFMFYPAFSDPAFDTFRELHFS